MKAQILLFLMFFSCRIIGAKVRNSRKLFDSAIDGSPKVIGLNETDEISSNYYNNVQPSHPKSLTLFDISNVVYKIAKERNLKVDSQKHNTKESDYQLTTSDDDKYSLKVSNLDNQFEYTVSDGNGNEISKFKTSDKSYMTNEASVFLSEALSNDRSKVRKLLSADIKASEVSQMLVDYLNNQNQLSGSLRVEKDGSINKVMMNIKHIFSVFIKSSENSNDLIISNTPTDLEFKDFKSNHFELRRSIELDETESSLQKYIEHISEDILKKIRLTISPTNFVKDIITNLEKDLSKEYELIATDVYGLTSDGYVTFDIFAKPDKNKKIGEIQVYPLEKEAIYGVSILKSEQVIEFKLPATELESSLPKIIAEIYETLKDETNFVYNIDNVHDAIKQNFLENNCSLLAVGNFDKKMRVGNYELDDDKEGKCDAKMSVFRFGLFSYGFIQYLHLSFENDLIMEEFMIAVNNNFTKTLTNSIKKFISDVKTVRERGDVTDGPGEYSFESLTTKINELLSGSVVCKTADGIFTCSKPISEDKIVDVISVRTFVDSKSSRKGTYYKITFNALNPNFGQTAVNVNIKEVNIPEKDNATAVEGLLADIKSLLNPAL